MMNTIDYDRIPSTVLHTITGEIDVEEVKSMMPRTYETVENAITKYGRFNFLIDARGLHFTDEAHLFWKRKIEDEGQFREKMNYMVFVLDYSAKARAAKKRRETETIRFFYDFDEASDWLLDKGTSITKRSGSNECRLERHGRKVTAYASETDR